MKKIDAFVIAIKCQKIMMRGGIFFNGCVLIIFVLIKALPSESKRLLLEESQNRRLHLAEWRHPLSVDTIGVNVLPVRPSNDLMMTTNGRSSLVFY